LASRVAQSLLGALGIRQSLAVEADHPALAWRRSGLMAVTGVEGGPGLICPVPLTALADGALAAFRTLTDAVTLPVNGAMLLGERARLLGLRRQGAISPNGSCRLLSARDGTIALNLPRTDDWDLVTAMVRQTVCDWSVLSEIIRGWPAAELVERGRLLGLAIALDQLPASRPVPFSVSRGGIRPKYVRRSPLVVDLSALWAGPLAGALIASAGAEVLKVESCRRPDGARSGSPAFFARMNGGKRHVVLDFSHAEGRAELRRLVDKADIVIEASRPRALRQLGIDADAQVARGAIWISITAHGRVGESADHIGFGDDAAIAGGLGVAMREAWGRPLFAGDAIADPLTGLLAALAGWAEWRRGGGALVSLSLAGSVAFGRFPGVADTDRSRAWQAMAEADDAPLYEPPTGP
jgi:hypothetical protein